MEELQARHPNRFKLWFTLDHPPEGAVPIAGRRRSGLPLPWVLVSVKPADAASLRVHGLSAPLDPSLRFLLTGGGRAGCPTDHWCCCTCRPSEEPVQRVQSTHPCPHCPRGQRSSGRWHSPLPCRLGLQQGLRLCGHDPGAPARPRGGHAAAALWTTPDGAAGLPPQPGQTGLLAEDALHLLSLPHSPALWLPPAPSQHPKAISPGRPSRQYQPICLTQSSGLDGPCRNNVLIAMEDGPGQVFPWKAPSLPVMICKSGSWSRLSHESERRKRAQLFPDWLVPRWHRSLCGERTLCNGFHLIFGA